MNKNVQSKKPRLLIFAGAGASFGVDKEKFPTTLGFRNLVPSSISSNKLFQQAEEFLESQMQFKPPHDIEKILWALQELDAALSPLLESSGFPNFLFKTNRVHHLVSDISGPHYISNLVSLKSQLQGLVSEINSVVYDLYGSDPTEESLKESWIPLLKWANEHFERVDIVTTNYDVVIERALHNAQIANVSTGRKMDWAGSTIDIDLWRRSEPSDTDQQGLLTKLHGSVDWLLGKGGTESSPLIRTGVKEFVGGHENRSIIYPGFKGIPSSEPFLTFHNYFRRAFGAATHLISIGFAYRDEHINELVRDAHQADRRVLVIDPSPPPAATLDTLGKVTTLPIGFGQDTQSPAMGTIKFIDQLTRWADGRLTATPLHKKSEAPHG